MKRRREEEKKDSEAKKRTEIDAIEPEKSIHADGGGWRRGKILGAGAHGKVNLAHFPKSAKLLERFKGFPSEVAVKSSLSESKVLEAEKEIYKSLPPSPHILRFLGDDVTISKDGQRLLNVFLEYASGRSLCHRIEVESKSGLLETEARGFTRSILLGLSHIHESNVVHRDVKPENVLLVEDDAADGKLVAKIGDFGSARRRNSSGKTDLGDFPLAGTGNYWAPETVFRIQEKASDIWALGCVVYAMLTGKRNWKGQLQVFDKTSGKQIKKLPGISAEAKDFLRKCFTESHIDRPDAATLLDHPFITGISSQKRQSRRSRR